MDGHELALKGWQNNPWSESLARYEVIRDLGLNPTLDIHGFRAQTGIFVTKRDAQGNPVEGTLRVLSDNPKNDIRVIGDHNTWGAHASETDTLHSVPGTPYYETTIKPLSNAMEYRLVVNGRQLIDPSATTFTTPEYREKMHGSANPAYLNSVFWDHDRPGAYKMTVAPADLRGKPMIIGETEVFTLVQKWRANDATGPRRVSETYKFIAESGIIDELKRIGYNAIEFLPFTPSVNGDAWYLRYQVYGLFGPNARYGTPDEFAQMIEAFNRAGIAVIMDAVVGHFPVRGNDGLQDLAAVGMANWKKADGQNLFGSVWSPWGTLRYDYANPFVRRFLTDGILTMLQRYRIGGIRFDNLDGIRLYDGPGGGGPQFLKELADEVHRYQPETTLIGEMYFGESDVLKRLDWGGFGYDYRTNSNLFDFFKDFLQKRTEEINMQVLRDAIRGPWGWQEASRVAYITNHDEAANARGGATGAYPATLLNGGSWYYVERKTIAFGAIPFFSSSVVLDMPQMRLLQEGTFNNNPAVDWGLRSLDSQSHAYRFFSLLSNLIRDNGAFAFQNFHPNIENHTDYDNRVISFLRVDCATGAKYYGVINLGDRAIANYEFGVEAPGKRFKVIADSDRAEFGGTDTLAKALHGSSIPVNGYGMHSKPQSIKIPYLGSYAVLLLEQESALPGHSNLLLLALQRSEGPLSITFGFAGRFW